MRPLERIARALAALVAGASIALDHLRDAPAPEPVIEIPPLRCPECDRSLEAGPHFHGDHAYWACDDDLGVLVTDGHGAMPS